MKTLKYLACVCFVAALSAHAQTLISASAVRDSFEQPLAVARLCFTPVNAANAPSGFRVGSVQVVPNEVCGKISMGVLQSGLGVAPTPTGVFYHIYVKSANSNVVLRDFGMTPITGATWSLDTYDANLAVLPVSAISVGTITTLPPGSAASCTITGGGPFLLNCSVPQGPQGIPGTTTATGTSGDFLVPGTLNAKRVNGLRLSDQFANNAAAVTDCGAGPCVLVSTPANANTDLFSPLASSNFLFALQKPRYFLGLFVGDLPPSTSPPTGYPSQLSYSQTGIQLDYCVFCIGRQMNLGGTTINNVDSPAFQYFVLSGNPTAGTGSKQIVGWENVIDTGNQTGDLGNVAILKANEYVVNNYSPSFTGTLLGPEFDCNHMSTSTLAGLVCGSIVFGPNDATKAAAITGVAYGSNSTANLRTNGALSRMVSYQAGWQNFLGASGSVQGFTGFQCCQTSGTSATAWSDNSYGYMSSTPSPMPTYAAGKTHFAYVLDGLAAVNANRMNFWLTGGNWNTGHFVYGGNGITADHQWWNNGLMFKVGSAPTSATDATFGFSASNPVSLGSVSNAYRWDSAGAAGSEMRALTAANNLSGIDVNTIKVEVATGTAPLNVTSTTPVPHLTTVPVTYNAAGTQQTDAHIVEDTGTLTSGTPSTATITLSGAAAFTSNATYNCSVTNKTTQANPLKISYTDGSHFVVTGPNTVTDAFSFVCAGK